MSASRAVHHRARRSRCLLPGTGITPRAARGGPPPTARASAPIDLTGYWVAVVNEDWRYRMVTPAKGEYGGVPITKEALQIVNDWDPAADEKAGEQCKSYGAAAVMRLPARLHITWQDDNTLRVDVDAGTQTRLFRFGRAQAGPERARRSRSRRGRATRPRSGNAAADVAVLRPADR